MENSPVGHTVPTSNNHYGRPIKACSAHWLLPKWPLVGVHTCTEGEEMSKCREEDVYSTLLNSTLLSTGRKERCLMDDPDFSGSSLKAGVRGGECKTKQESSHRENTRIEQLFLHLLSRDGDRDDNIDSH